MHWEHTEFYARVRVIRLEVSDVARTTVVIRCRGVRRLRLLIAMALMRLAGRLGGFRRVKLIRED
jgi:hypothetical protein